MKRTKATLPPNKLVFAHNLSKMFFGASPSVTAVSEEAATLLPTQCFHL